MIFDVAVIGGGIGGYSTAIRASELGLNVVLIEESKMGGTCLNVGCIPTKMLVKKASFLKKAKILGLKTDSLSLPEQFNLANIIEHKDQKVQKMSQGLTFLLQSHKIKLLQGRASFVNQNTLEINGKKIQAKNIVIATGSSPLDLKILKADHKVIFNSNSLLNLKTLPKSLAIIGGGYIGCEFAFFFNALGSQVVLIEKEKTLLPFADKDITALYQKSLEKQGIKILTSACVENITTDAHGAKIVLQNQTLETEKVLLAVGRKLNTDNLNLEKIPLSLHHHGSIEVNSRMQTKIPHIYAVGDITHKIQLAHLALHQGIVAAHNIAHENQEISYNAVPTILYTSPELACVGMTLKEASDQGLQAKEAVFPLAALGIAIALEETDGFVKLVFEEKTKKILGAYLLGDNVSFIISEIALAITANLSLDDLANTIHPHPTLSEAIFEAALVGEKLPMHILKK